MKFISQRGGLASIAFLILIVSSQSIETFLFTQKFDSLSANSNTTPVAEGNKATTSKQVTSPPYEISSCDQVVEVSGNILTDQNDFTKKSPAFFTLSVYMVNQFEKRDGNTLKTSLSVDKIVNPPKLIPGSVSCVSFSETGSKEITMCLPDKSSANQILKAYAQLMKCRMGDNLKDSPAQNIQSILKASCLGLDVTFDPKRFNGDTNLAQASLSSAMNNALKDTAKNLKGANVEGKKTQPRI